MTIIIYHAGIKYHYEIALTDVTLINKIKKIMDVDLKYKLHGAEELKTKWISPDNKNYKLVNQHNGTTIIGDMYD